MPTVHSPLGASKAERWLNCPGSVTLCEGLPDEQSPYAAEGSAAHYFAEQCLRNGCNAADLIGQADPDYPEWPMTQEMAQAVQVYVDHCRHYGLGGLAPTDLIDVHIEHRFALTEIDPILFGTADCVVFHRFSAILYVIDYKHGARVLVSPYENAQLMYYALGAIQIYGDQIGAVEIHVVQPRGGGSAIKKWQAPLPTLAWYAGRLRDGVEDTRIKTTTYSRGTWCRFCPARSVCPEWRGDAEKQFGVMFLDVDLGFLADTADCEN